MAWEFSGEARRGMSVVAPPRGATAPPGKRGLGVDDSSADFIVALVRSP